MLCGVLLTVRLMVVRLLPKLPTLRTSSFCCFKTVWPAKAECWIAEVAIDEASFVATTVSPLCVCVCVFCAMGWSEESLCNWRRGWRGLYMEFWVRLWIRICTPKHYLIGCWFGFWISILIFCLGERERRRGSYCAMWLWEILLDTVCHTNLWNFVGLWAGLMPRNQANPFNCHLLSRSMSRSHTALSIMRNV